MTVMGRILSQKLSVDILSLFFLAPFFQIPIYITQGPASSFLHAWYSVWHGSFIDAHTILLHRRNQLIHSKEIMIYRFCLNHPRNYSKWSMPMSALGFLQNGSLDNATSCNKITSKSIILIVLQATSPPGTKSKIKLII